MAEQLPKILVPCINAWRDDGCVHTLIDIFSNWDRDRIAQVYTRADLPNTSICDRFFQISESSVLLSCYRRHIRAGRVVRNQTDISDTVDCGMIEKEHSRYARSREKHSWLMSACRELVWLFGRWRTREFDQFILGFQPDVLFMPVYPTLYMGWIQKYIIKKTGKPFVCYLADDNYTYEACGNNPLAYIHRFFLRRIVRDLVTGCEKLFVITPKQRVEYQTLFGKDSVVLTKGIDFGRLSFREKPLSDPIKMVYTGKMVIGRDITLAAISRAIGEINRDGVKITLDIYSPDISSMKVMNQLNSNGCRFMGVVPRAEVEGIQSSADIVVFVESLEPRYRRAARLSFSTKLTDYFRSGKCIFAVGGREIAPIDYLKKEDAAVLATGYEEIEAKLREMCQNPEIIMKYSRHAFECGRRNHDIRNVRLALIDTINAVLQKA